jgi:RNA polymerase sigma-70 factor (ECF subfamily)
MREKHLRRMRRLAFTGFQVWIPRQPPHTYGLTARKECAMFANAIARPALPPSCSQPAQTPWRRLLVAFATHQGEFTSGDSHVADTDATTPQAEFEAFFHRHHQDIFSYLWRMTGEEQAAYDLSQETFIRAWQRFSTLQRYDYPAGWLFRVATNLALKHLRHRRVVTRLEPTPLHNDDDLVEPANRVPAHYADHAEQVVQDDLVRRVLLALSPRPRAVLVLHDVYGLSADEVAQTLKMTRAAVKMMLCRAREQFRIRYRRQEVQP